jgi:hypothetical protein
MVKSCKTCQEEKPTSEFYTHPQTRDRLGQHCKDCQRAYYRQLNSDPARAEKKRERSAKWYRENTTPESRRSAHLLRMYSLSIEDFEKRVEDQYGVCAVCKNLPAQFNIDHDHSCCAGKKSCGRCVRELLCDRCNKVLGAIEDDLDLLESMKTYLAKWQRVPLDL